MNFVALRVVPEVHFSLAVVAVYGGELVRVALTSVHAVLAQHILVAAVSVEEQAKPRIVLVITVSCVSLTPVYHREKKEL